MTHLLGMFLMHAKSPQAVAPSQPNFAQVARPLSIGSHVRPTQGLSAGMSLHAATGHDARSSPSSRSSTQYVPSQFQLPQPPAGLHAACTMHVSCSLPLGEPSTVINPPRNRRPSVFPSSARHLGCMAMSAAEASSQVKHVTPLATSPPNRQLPARRTIASTRPLAANHIAVPSPS